jgi:hypothetical protein
MLFRTELGAGLIKLRHDDCWRNLTCLYYHYETQPLPISVAVTPRGIAMPGYDIWFIRFIRKLLENDRPTLKLLRDNPFADRAPKFVRALYYRYRYTTAAEKRETGAWWHRELIDQYLPPVSLDVLIRTMNDER